MSMSWRDRGTRGPVRSVSCANEKPRRSGARREALPPRSGVRNDAAHAAALRALDAELDLAVDDREDRVVAAETNAGARMELGAALAKDDVAGFDLLAAVDLDAEILRIRIAAVAAGAYALFMCHDSFSSGVLGGVDAGDFDFGVMLPMARFLAEMLAAAEFHDADLVRATVRLDRRGNTRARNQRRTDRDLVALADQKDLVERDAGADF